MSKCVDKVGKNKEKKWCPHSMLITTALPWPFGCSMNLNLWGTSRCRIEDWNKCSFNQFRESSTPVPYSNPPTIIIKEPPNYCKPL